jgi:hypothetical protein
MTPTISLCVITSNEAPVVERFLNSFKDSFDELCMVRAVGNQPHDKTLTLAKAWCAKHGKKFAAGVYDNHSTAPTTLGAPVNDGNPATWPHVDDFAAARNMAWGMATCPWQFWADMDDLLQAAVDGQPGGAELIRLCAANDKHDFIHFTYDIRAQNERNVRERLFRTGISSWTDPVHEKAKLEPKADGKWKGLIEARVIFEHAPEVGKARDPMRNRRIMAYHTRYIDLYAFEIHREWFYEWQASGKPEHAENATRWAELAHQTDCLPEQRYDMFLNQSKIAAAKDVDHAIDLCWSAIRIHPKDRAAWGLLAEWELKAGRGGRGAVATGFMQSIPKAPESGYPQSNRYHGWQGADLRVRSLRAAGQEEMARKSEDSIFKANGSRISLLHATRGRPELALLTRNTFLRAAFMPLGVEHIFAIDADDEASLAALKDYRHVVVTEPNGCVKAWNAAATASTGHVLVQLSDDWNPCHDWDVLIWEALENAAGEQLKDCKDAKPIGAERASGLVGVVPMVLAIHDGHRNDALLCMAICTRARYEQQKETTNIVVDPNGKGFGWSETPHLFHPEYFGVFSDTEFTVRAYDDGVVVQAQHIVMEHRHPIWQGTPVDQWDETHRRQNAPERYAEGKATFNRRNPKHAIP